MFKIPLRHLTIHSRFTPRTIKSRLEKIILEPPIPMLLWRVPAGKMYSGNISSNSFRLQRLWSYGPKNLWIPTFCGTINRAPVGSVINVTAALEGFDAIVIVVYHLIFLVVMLIGLNIDFVLFMYIFVIYALANGLGYYLGFIQGVRFFELQINSVLSKD